MTPRHKREKKQAKKNRTATEKAAAKATKRAVAEAEADATTKDETSARAKVYFGYDLAGASEPPSVCGECSSEHSEEEYGFIYREIPL